MPETRRGILKKVCNMMKDQRSGLRKNQKRIRKGSGKGSGKESEKDREKNQKRIRKNQKGIRKMIRKRRSPVYETRRKQRFPERVTGSGNMFFRSSDRFFQPAVPIIRLNLSDASGQMHPVRCIRSAASGQSSFSLPLPASMSNVLSLSGRYCADLARDL